MKLLIEHDNFKHPQKGHKVQKPSEELSLTVEQLMQARKAINDQLELNQEEFPTHEYKSRQFDKEVA